MNHNYDLRTKVNTITGSGEGEQGGSDGHRQPQDRDDEGEKPHNVVGEPPFEPPFEKVRGGSRIENEEREDRRMKAFFRDPRKVCGDGNSLSN